MLTQFPASNGENIFIYEIGHFQNWAIWHEYLSQYIVSIPVIFFCLTLWSLSLPLPSLSTKSRELLSQFSTCSGWRWFRCGLKIKENCHVLVNWFHGNFRFKTLGWRKMKSVLRDVKWCFNASLGLKELKCTCKRIYTNSTKITLLPLSTTKVVFNPFY